MEAAVYEALLRDQKSMCELMAALGHLLRRIATTTEGRLPNRCLKAADWLRDCEFEHRTEVRIAAAVASIYDKEIGPIVTNVSRANKEFAWVGVDLPARMAAVLDRRVRLGNAAELRRNPLGGACEIDPGDATLFIEGSVEDGLIEDLLFAFLVLDWQEVKTPKYRSVEVLPSYAVLKCLFLAGEIRCGEEPKRLVADRRIPSLLAAGDLKAAADIAVKRLKIAGLRPLAVPYPGGVNARRLAGGLLIPVRQRKLLDCGIFHEEPSMTGNT